MALWLALFPSYQILSRLENLYPTMNVKSSSLAVTGGDRTNRSSLTALFLEHSYYLTRLLFSWKIPLEKVYLFDLIFLKIVNTEKTVIGTHQVWTAFSPRSKPNNNCLT